MAKTAIIVGSGPAGSVVAWTLVQAGWEVLMLEKGPHMHQGLGERPSGELGTRYGSDENKRERFLGYTDPLLEPNTGRTQAQANDGVARTMQGHVAPMGSAVGGTAIHYNAKMPRFWSHDFNTLSLFGPIDGANLADWPLSYDELAPYYDDVEHHLGVIGDVSQMPERTLQNSPRARQFVMPPLPDSIAAQLLADGAKTIGWNPYPLPAAANSVPRNGRPRCNSCGLCSGFGCPIHARNDGLVSYLNPAMLGGNVTLKSRAFVHKVKTTTDGRRATGVIWRDINGVDHEETADLVVVAGSPVHTARLLLLSKSEAHPHGLSNRSDQLGRNLMLHNSTQAGALFAEDDMHGWRSQSTTIAIDDTVGPYSGPETIAAGLPYVKSGYIQVGSTMMLSQEAHMYHLTQGVFGMAHKQLMKVSPLRLRIAGMQLIGEDMPQLENRVDLDPEVKDVWGFPVARVTYSPHLHEQVSIAAFGPRMTAACQAAPGALGAGFLPFDALGQAPPSHHHQGGTARMGDDPDSSVCDRWGKLHEVDNVFVADGSVMPTFPGFNPTITIMALAQRTARFITGQGAPDIASS